MKNIDLFYYLIYDNSYKRKGNLNMKGSFVWVKILNTMKL